MKEQHHFCHMLCLGMQCQCTVMWGTALWCRRSRIHRYVAAPIILHLSDVYCVGLENVGLKSKSPGKAAPAPAAANNKKAHKKTVGSQFRNTVLPTFRTLLDVSRSLGLAKSTITRFLQ